MELLSDLDLFNIFKSENMLLSVEIIGYEKIADIQSKTFNFYIIEIKTTLLNYQIKKRYSEFRSFYNMLEGKIKIDFPQKIYFQNFSHEKLEKRKKGLNEFLHILNKRYLTVTIPQYLNFLEIKKNYMIYNIVIKNMTVKTISNEQDKLFKFLKLLNETDNKISLLGELEEFLIIEQPKLYSKQIIKFFIGEKDVIGLFQICGKIEENEGHLICSRGLKFLCTIMDYEFNKNFENFTSVFCLLPSSSLVPLCLNYHINSKNSCKKYAFILLNKYINNLSNPMKIMTQILDNSAFDNFTSWLVKKNNNSRKTEAFDLKNFNENMFGTYFYRNKGKNDIQLITKFSNQYNFNYKNNILLEYFRKIDLWDTSIRKSTRINKISDSNEIILFEYNYKNQIITIKWNLSIVNENNTYIIIFENLNFNNIKAIDNSIKIIIRIVYIDESKSLLKIECETNFKDNFISQFFCENQEWTNRIHKFTEFLLNNN